MIFVAYTFAPDKLQPANQALTHIRSRLLSPLSLSLLHELHTVGKSLVWQAAARERPAVLYVGRGGGEEDR